MKTFAQFWVLGLQVTLSMDWRVWALPLQLDLSGSWRKGEKDIYFLCFLFEICHGYSREDAHR